MPPSPTVRRALLHRPVGELAQRSEQSAKVDAAAERGRTFRVAGLEGVVRIKAFAIGIRRRVHAFALQSERVVQIEIGLADVIGGNSSGERCAGPPR